MAEEKLGYPIEEIPNGFWFNLGTNQCLYLTHVDVAGLGLSRDSVTIIFENHSSTSVREGMLTLPRGTMLYSTNAEAH